MHELVAHRAVWEAAARRVVTSAQAAKCCCRLVQGFVPRLFDAAAVVEATWGSLQLGSQCRIMGQEERHHKRGDWGRGDWLEILHGRQPMACFDGLPRKEARGIWHEAQGRLPEDVKAAWREKSQPRREAWARQQLQHWPMMQADPMAIRSPAQQREHRRQYTEGNVCEMVELAEMCDFPDSVISVVSLFQDIGFLPRYEHTVVCGGRPEDFEQCKFFADISTRPSRPAESETACAMGRRSQQPFVLRISAKMLWLRNAFDM